LGVFKQLMDTNMEVSERLNSLGKQNHFRTGSKDVRRQEGCLRVGN